MSQASFALTPGTVFHGRYAIVRCIKAGGMGAVYEVMDSKTESRRALKVMLATFVEEEDFRTRFEREAKITGNVESDHLVRVFDAGIDEGTSMPFLVMELLRGEELGGLIKRTPLAPAGAVGLLFQAALALDKTHAAGIIHRDLKPENLFLTRRDDGTPSVKVLDFGIAKIVADNQTHATKAIGTPLYMAPEQAMGQGVVGARADVYALGHIAYTLMVGEAYWKEDSRAADNVFLLLSRVQLGVEEPPCARALRRKKVMLPAGFDAWFLRVTATKPDDRFDRATTAIAALGEALGVSTGRPMSLEDMSGSWPSSGHPPSRSSGVAGSTGDPISGPVIPPSPVSSSGRVGVSQEAMQSAPSMASQPISQSGSSGAVSNTGGVAMLSEPPALSKRKAKPYVVGSALAVGLGAIVLIARCTLGGGAAVSAESANSAASAPIKTATTSPPPEPVVAPQPSVAAAPTPSAAADASPSASATAPARNKAPAAGRTSPRAPAHANPPKHEGIF